MFLSEKIVLVLEIIFNCFGLWMFRIDVENWLKGGMDVFIVFLVSFVFDGI